MVVRTLSTGSSKGMYASVLIQCDGGTDNDVIDEEQDSALRSWPIAFLGAYQDFRVQFSVETLACNQRCTTYRKPRMITLEVSATNGRSLASAYPLLTPQ